MKVYRLAKGKYADDLSGKGAELAGARWNSKGIPMLYTSESRALCLVEIAVHVPIGNIPTDYFLVEIEIPDEVEITFVEVETLSKDWNSLPHSQFTQNIGDAFISQNEFLVMRVPSAVVQGDFNYLLNPRHGSFNQIKLINKLPFSFDERLFVR
jgi:RES domain-containing protein